MSIQGGEVTYRIYANRTVDQKKYRIAGKFGEEFNLANWRGIERIAKF